MASPVVARAPAASFGAHSLASSRRVGSRRALRGDVCRRSSERRVSVTVVSDGKKVVFVGGTGLSLWEELRWRNMRTSTERFRLTATLPSRASCSKVKAQSVNVV